MAQCNTCRGSSPNPKAYGCNSWKPRQISNADIIAYAQRGGAEGTDQICFSQACLMAGRIIYWKNNPGDCPTETKLKLSPVSSVVKYGGIAGTGIAAASGLSLATTGGAGIGASAGGSGAVLGGLPAVIGTAATVVGLALIPLAIWGIISAHHKIAVAREQATLCDVSQAFNQWADTIESGIASGLIVVSDAKNAVPIMEQQLIQACQAIKQECNAACYVIKAIKSLNLYAVEKLFDSLSPRVASGNPANLAQPANAAQGKAGVGTLAVISGGALVAAKLAGAFA